MKRKALADLFWILQHIGLSYHKGLTFEKNDLKHEFTQLPPLDVSVYMNALNKATGVFTRSLSFETCIVFPGYFICKWYFASFQYQQGGSRNKKCLGWLRLIFYAILGTVCPIAYSYSPASQRSWASRYWKDSRFSCSPSVTSHQPLVFTLYYLVFPLTSLHSHQNKTHFSFPEFDPYSTFQSLWEYQLDGTDAFTPVPCSICNLWKSLWTTLYLPRLTYTTGTSGLSPF